MTMARSARAPWAATLLQHVLAPLVLTALLAGCTGTPQPVPIPDPARFRSTALLPTVEADVVLVGLPGATAGAGAVTVRDDASGAEVEVTASDAGGFWATLTARANDPLQVRYAGSDAAAYAVPEQGVTAALPPRPISGVPPVVSAGGGKVRVRGEVDAGVTTVIVASTVSADVVETPVDAQHQFDATLRAQPGEAIEAYAAVGVLGGAWRVSAP